MMALSTGWLSRRFGGRSWGTVPDMSPADLVRLKASRSADPRAREAAEFAAVRLSSTMRQRDGVVTRAELITAGLTRPDIDRLIRRKGLRQVHKRVYVDHTGPLTYGQRVWAAVLAAEPAVVCGPTLIYPDPTARTVHVAVEASRHLRTPEGVVLHRVPGLDALAQWKAAPPRMRREDAVLLLVHDAESELDVIRLLTDAARDRAIGVVRLREAEKRRRRLSRRAFVGALLDDIATGVQSVLEHGYLTHVERAHGLPRPSRQVERRRPGGKEYRDVEYEDFTMVVELDGRLSHDGFHEEGRDAARDLSDQVSGRLTTRLRWRQVFGTPCETAASLAALLQHRGWHGTPRPCGPGCPVGSAETPG